VISLAVVDFVVGSRFQAHADAGISFGDVRGLSGAKKGIY
jgi:hypothetical protein